VGRRPFDGFATGVAARGKFVMFRMNDGRAAFRTSAARFAQPVANFRTTGEPATWRVAGRPGYCADAYSLFILRTG